MYGQVLSYLGWREAVIESMNSMSPDPSKAIIPPELLSPLDVQTDDDTRQGILSVIMCLCLAEMFIGGWLAFLDKDQMVFGHPPQQGRVSNTMIPLKYRVN